MKNTIKQEQSPNLFEVIPTVRILFAERNAISISFILAGLCVFLPVFKQPCLLKKN
jgi:hypothetical protein